MSETCHYLLDRELPVLHHADVVVVGGGPGGIAAAVTAARQGAHTLLIEKGGCLGGMATLGEVHPFMPNHLKGEPLDGPVYLEWRERAHQYYYPPGEREAEAPENHQQFISKEAAMLAAEDLCLEAGVDLLYHHQLADVLTEEDGIDALVLLSKSGLTAARGRAYVDATGDGDLAALAGCAYEQGGPTGFCQPLTTCFKLSHVDTARIPSREAVNRLYDAARERGEIDCLRENVLFFPWYDDDVVHFNTTRVIHKSATSGQELSEAEIIARRQIRQFVRFLRAEVPGFEKARLHSIAQTVGIRESRRVLGLAYVTKDDYVACRKFDDSIARVHYAVDIHNPDGTGTERIRLPEDEWYEIPFGSVVARDKNNLLIGGRPISVDHAVHSSMRVMPPACTVGQAAGLGAALCARESVTSHELDGRRIHQLLKDGGAPLC